MGTEQLLASYATAIGDSVSQKDNNVFWPRGIPALSHPSAHILFESFQPLISQRQTVNRMSLYPTSVLCLLLYLTHGIRRRRAGRTERLTVARHLLRHVVESRSGVLVPDGPMHLRLWRKLPGAGAVAEASDKVGDLEYVLESFRLGAQAWALGEAAFFFCHRLLTERHGPYVLPNRTVVACRHFSNLDLCRHLLSPTAESSAPSQVAIWWFLQPELVNAFSYDLFANPIFALAPQEDCLGAAVWASETDGRTHRLDLSRIRSLRHMLARWTMEILTVVEGATDQHLAEIQFFTMRSVTERILGRVVLSDREAITPPFDYRVVGPMQLLQRYYDLREDWPPQEPLDNID